jgi:nitrite reductase/ring-hydroxylating ferredoxin subunit
MMLSTRIPNSGPAGYSNRKLTPDITEEKVAKAFMIILRNKIRSLFGCIALCIGIIACAPDQYDDPIPYQPFPEIVLNLNLPEYVGLRTTGATLGVSGGIRGILIYCKQAGEYLAYERNCSFHPNDACATVNVDASSLFLIDPCCGSTFDLATGLPTGGVATRPLVQYKTTYDGSLLIVTDERLD